MTRWVIYSSEQQKGGKRRGVKRQASDLLRALEQHGLANPCTRTHNMSLYVIPNSISHASSFHCVVLIELVSHSWRIYQRIIMFIPHVHLMMMMILMMTLYLIFR